MVKIEEGGAPGNVPLVYYDKDGNRKVVGEATVALRQGQLRVVGVFNDIPEATGLAHISLDGFSIPNSEEAVETFPKGGPPPKAPTDAQVGSAFRRYMEGKLNG
jgi:hypothetical protein